ncbi:MAG TPA: aminotransferase class I/II-fold pyridoxal phosphate-dependent enzyme, partial [Rhodopila sp.]|nr:aminotransferase class I/II-fold pyridoxal phosphate-dependent enzyme [Rhodopila sp.]
MRGANLYLQQIGTTIFTVMSALANEHRSINLGQGFPDTEGPQDVVLAAAEALQDQRNQYPPMPGVPELRQAVAAANQRFYGLDVDWAREVTVTSGATEAIIATLMAVVDPGDEVVLIEPLYDTYVPVVRLLGAIPRFVRLTPPRWELPRDELAAAFGPKTKAILFNSPMNPSGKVFTAEELGFIAGLAQEWDTYAICDEVYEHLLFDGLRHIPLMTLPGMRDRTMRIGSAGKTFSLTGWKVGYVTACPALSTLVQKAHQNLTFTT